MPGQTTRAKGWRGALSASLGNKLLLFAAALVLVPGALLVAIAERSGRDSLQQVIGRQLAREARHTAGRLSTVLRAQRDALSSFARQDLMREIRVADIDKRVSMALATLRDGSPVAADFLVLDLDRRVVASSDPALIGPLPAWADPRWSTPARGVRMFGPTTPSTRDSAVLVMSTLIRDPDDGRRRLGTLVGLLDWGLLTAVTRSVRGELRAQGIVADVLVGRVGDAIIGGAHGPDGPHALALGELHPVAGRAPDAERGYGVHEEAGLIIGRAALPPDLPDWELFVVVPRSDALAPARSLGNRLALTMGLAVVAALVLAGLAARRVVQPLTELTGAIRGLSRGAGGARSVPVRTDDEVGTLAVAFNEMAAELDRAQRDLVEAEKFAFVGELAAGVAHEIRTSLGVLGSSAQMLEKSLPNRDESEAIELAEMIRAEVARLGRVVSDLLTLDRARPLELEAVPVSDPVFRAADFVGLRAQERGIRVLCSTPPAEPLVRCEPELIYQVAVNLLVNALEALPSGGCIEVRILAERDGLGGFEVRDDGPGIPEALGERIFQPFVTAREGGVGLGLTFVKRVVHDHGGRVAVESGARSGTCIRIRLPTAGREQ